ncbi:MAG: deoxyguanosinetriphosphate triphosphohydrolase [Pirellulales bacterium]
MTAPSGHFEPLPPAAREAILLAPYAMRSADSRGRKHPEPSHPYRGPFQRDHDRIIHCAAFRRLSQKTQVFTGHQLGDYHRSRLTHTLEVTSIARTLARALRVNEDLVEALALQHDLGHPPFGHAGEDTLDQCLQAVGGFDHNAQALRIVEELEARYPGFAGLNLSDEVLEGQRHRVEKCARTGAAGCLLETQIVDAADSLAYDSHDPDDALEVGLLTFDELMQIRMWREAVHRVRRRYASLDDSELRRATVHELIDWQVNDLYEATIARLAAHELRSADDVRRTPTLVLPGAELAELKTELEQFLHERVYRHADLLALRQRAQERLQVLFERYVARTELLPTTFQARIAVDGIERTVGDYLAGMTDRFADQEYERIHN